MSLVCEIPDYNPPGKEIIDILKESRTIAIVGCSPKTNRDSYKVAKYLLDHGYKVIPVRPAINTILDQKTYPDLKSIPESVDIVDIFRRPDTIPEICEDAVKIGAKIVWMQAGLASSKGAKIARDKGLKVIQSKCIMVEHSKISALND